MRAFAIAVLLSTLLPVLRSQAADLRLQLRVPPGAGCPSSAQVEAEVDALLAGGGTSPGGPAGGLRAVATVSAKGAGFTVRIRTELSGSAGERILGGDSCAAVASAAALILAMALDPDAVRGAPPVVAAPPTPQPSLKVQASAAPPDPNARVVFIPAMLGAVGALPDTALGIGITALVRVGRSGALAASAHHLPGISGRSDARPDTGGNFSLAGAGAQACLVSAQAAASTGQGAVMRLCAGVNVDRVTATGFGVSDPGHGSAWLVAPETTVGLDWLVTPRLGLSLSLAATAPISRPAFVLDGVGTVWRPSAVAGRLGLGVSVGL